MRREDLPLSLLGFRFSSSWTKVHWAGVVFNGKEALQFARTVQLDEAIKIVKNHDRLYKKVEYWKKEAVIAKHDLLGQPNDSPKLFVLRGIDGGVHHAILVAGSIIFYSNLGQCLTLSKASLDWCCNCNGGFSTVHKVVQFRK